MGPIVTPSGLNTFRDFKISGFRVQTEFCPFRAFHPFGGERGEKEEGKERRREGRGREEEGELKEEQRRNAGASAAEREAQEENKGSVGVASRPRCALLPSLWLLLSSLSSFFVVFFFFLETQLSFC